MALTKGFQALALKLQEVATGMSHDDIRKRISDTIGDKFRGSGSWAYLVDVFGDDQSGYCVYSMDGDLRKADYEIGETAGKATCMVDCENSVNVIPTTTYTEEAEDDDHYAAMEAAHLYGEFAPAYERFISKDERKGAAAGSFAGKGKSFPILKPEDVMAAVRSIGRAGSDNYDAGTLKKNIVRIAKAKGWEKQLPKAWRAGSDTTEAATTDLEITGDFVPLREGAVGQDGTAYLKLIAPGRGSSGYYPESVLERDGPKVFTKGTKNFWNHQTEAEEAARPEGDLRDLASVLTEDAHYEKSGPAGPGLYAKANVFEQFRQPVDSLAKHIGMSIRATGKAKEGTAPDGKAGPIIQELNRALSVDYVTTPGAGGQILQLFEAARSAPTSQREGETEMTDAEGKKLLETVRKSNQRLALFEARDVADKKLATIRLPEATRARLRARVLGMAPINEDGDLDVKAFETLIDVEAKEEAAYLSQLSEGRVVVDMGSGAPPEPTPAQLEEQNRRLEAELDNHASRFDLKTKEAREIFTRGREAFDYNYNSAADPKDGVLRGTKEED